MIIRLRNLVKEENGMFREMRRFKQQISNEECIQILKEQPRGVLSVLGDDDYPYGMPINHFYNEADGKIYFHGGMAGHKIDAIRRHDKVSFCVYDEGYRREGEWALNIRSVIVFGRVEFVEDKEKLLEIARLLSYKFTDDEEYIEHELVHSGPGTLMFAIVPEHITGKLVNES
jgi:nitroimidazol reductase NimA-like FMN-containing flavoprotein (pyridoxamine 5'-phosphate oxidase superfamily)